MALARFGAAVPWWINTRTVYCIGRNYLAHIAELNNTVPDKPFWFIKPGREGVQVAQRVPQIFSDNENISCGGTPLQAGVRADGECAQVFPWAQRYTP